MASNHKHIDLVTLEQVQQLLSDTDFASVQDIARSGALGDLGGAVSTRPTVAAASTKVAVDATGQSPLPRRR